MPDVLRATYADLKTVKTRSTCQLILELPIEALTDVVALLGAPVPGNEVWVAVARLRPDVAAPVVQIEHANDEAPTPRPLSQIAAMMCGKVTFRRFLTEMMDAGGGLTAEDAAGWVRRYCKVASRRELDSNPEAAALFRDLRGSFDAWMMVPA